MTLYEINEQIKDALNRLFESADEETGEVSVDAMQELEDLKAAREEKLDNIGAYIKNLEAEAKAISDEMSALKERLDSKTRKIERLRNYVSWDLLNNGEKNFETARVAFSFRKSTSVKVDEDKLPKKYFVKKVTYSPDKKEIRKALDEGIAVKGAELVEKQNLQIK